MILNFNFQDKAKIFMAKYYCVRLHALFGVALAAGLVAAKMVARYPVPKPIQDSSGQAYRGYKTIYQSAV